MKGPKDDSALQKTWPASYIRGPCVATTAYIIFSLKKCSVPSPHLKHHNKNTWEIQVYIACSEK